VESKAGEQGKCTRALSMCQVAVAETVTWSEMARSEANASLHLTLVEERCQSCSYEGGQATQLREARTCGDTHWIYAAQQSYSRHTARYGITLRSDMGGNRPVNHTVKLSLQGPDGMGPVPYYSSPYTRKYGYGCSALVWSRLKYTVSIPV